MDITAVRMNSKGVIPQAGTRVASNNYTSAPSLASDTFQKSNSVTKSISFNALRFPSGVYEYHEFELAKKFINKTGSELRDALKQAKLAELKNAPLSKKYYETAGFADNEAWRPIAAIFSLGLTEAENALHKVGILCYKEISGYEKEAEKYSWENIDKISNLIGDLRAGHKGVAEMP